MATKQQGLNVAVGYRPESGSRYYNITQTAGSPKNHVVRGNLNAAVGPRMLGECWTEARHAPPISSQGLQMCCSTMMRLLNLSQPVQD